MKLTARAVETAKPAAVRREIPDALMPSLYLVVQPSGTKSWAVRYRHNGTTRKYTLGSYPAIDLKAAASLAGKALRAVAEGRDPGQEKAQARSARADRIDARRRSSSSAIASAQTVLEQRRRTSACCGCM